MYILPALLFGLQKNKSWEQKNSWNLKCEFKKTFGAKTTVASYAYFARLVVRDDQCWHLESNLTTTLACLSARKCQENNSNPLFLQLTIMRKIISDSHLFRYWSLLMFPTYWLSAYVKGYSYATEAAMHLVSNPFDPWTSSPWLPVPDFRSLTSCPPGQTIPIKSITLDKCV